MLIISLLFKRTARSKDLFFRVLTSISLFSVRLTSNHGRLEGDFESTKMHFNVQLLLGSQPLDA